MDTEPKMATDAASSAEDGVESSAAKFVDAAALAARDGDRGMGVGLCSLDRGAGTVWMGLRAKVRVGGRRDSRRVRVSLGWIYMLTQVMV